MRFKTMTAVFWLALAATLMAGAGCRDMNIGWWNWSDPGKPIRTPDRATVNPIFSQVGPTDQTRELVPNATMPKPEDLVYTEEDYVIGPTDFLTVEVLDLFQEGVPMMLPRQVTHSGHLSLPLLTERIKAGGLTSEGLTEAIKKAYRPDVLRDPVVSVTVTGPRQNTYSILGAVGRAGPYPILRKNFTLLEALASAGDVTQLGIEWIYVIRPARKPEAPTTKPAVPTKPAKPRTQEERLKGLEEFIPGIVAAPPADERVLLSSVSTAPAPDAATTAPAPLTESTETYHWMYVGKPKRWIRVRVKVPTTKPKPGVEKPKVPPRPIVGLEREKDKDPFKWMQYDLTGRARIIAIDLRKLKAGNPRINIIIRDNDIIHVPPLEVGEFYVMGEVLRPGVYSLTGRQITAKMAVAAAGNLGPLSWPNNSILIRRVGRHQEQTIPLPLLDIFAGREPDIFLKPNDVIAVGSHWSTPFIAVWRNAFRLTYGFGFIYDRNFSEQDFEIPLIAPDSGWREDR